MSTSDSSASSPSQSSIPSNLTTSELSKLCLRIDSTISSTTKTKHKAQHLLTIGLSHRHLSLVSGLLKKEKAKLVRVQKEKKENDKHTKEKNERRERLLSWQKKYPMDQIPTIHTILSGKYTKENFPAELHSITTEQFDLALSFKEEILGHHYGIGYYFIHQTIGEAHPSLCWHSYHFVENWPGSPCPCVSDTEEFVCPDSPYHNEPNSPVYQPTSP
jgi:hypothetical protein